MNTGDDDTTDFRFSFISNLRLRKLVRLVPKAEVAIIVCLYQKGADHTVYLKGWCDMTCLKAND